MKPYLRSTTGDSRLTIWCGFWWAQRKDERNKPHRCCQCVSRGGGGGQGVWTSHLPLPALLFPPPFVTVTTFVCFFYCEMLCQCCEIFPSSPSFRPLWISPPPTPSSPASRRLPAPTTFGFPCPYTSLNRFLSITRCINFLTNCWSYISNFSIVNTFS